MRKLACHQEWRRALARRGFSPLSWHRAKLQCPSGYRLQKTHHHDLASTTSKHLDTVRFNPSFCSSAITSTQPFSGPSSFSRSESTWLRSALATSAPLNTVMSMAQALPTISGRTAVGGAVGPVASWREAQRPSQVESMSEEHGGSPAEVTAREVVRVGDGAPVRGSVAGSAGVAGGGAWGVRMASRTNMAVKVKRISSIDEQKRGERAHLLRLRFPRAASTPRQPR